MNFDEVLPEHFSALSRTPFPHILIDRALQQIAGGGVSGNDFRRDALVAAGWNHPGLAAFGRYPADACKALNRIRDVLAVTEKPEEILVALEKLADPI